MQALGSCQRAGQEDAEHLAQPELGRVHGSGAGRLHAEDGVSRLRRGLPSWRSEEGHLQADREGTVPLNRHTNYQKLEKRADKKNPNQKKRICSKSNILYKYECNEKDSCPDSNYDGQSSKNFYTRSLNHDYKNEKKHDNSFMHLHQEKSHNNENENFKLSVTRFYGNDRLSCEIAEAVILRQRTGEILNLKSEFHNPPIVKVTRSVQRGL